jgi:nucleotide-binding universal stress UspA family protein
MVSILMALDDDIQQAHAQTDAVADLVSSAGEMRVYLLHVFDDNPEGASVKQIEAVREARERLESLRVVVELPESRGVPAEQFLFHAETEGVDKTCVSGRRRSPQGKSLIRSLSQGVILGRKLPVLVCGH